MAGVTNKQFPMFSVVHATARPNGWQKVYSAYLNRAAHPNTVQYVVSLSERQTFVENANCGAKAATAPVIIIATDDMYPPYEWDTGLVEIIPANLNRSFVVEVNVKLGGKVSSDIQFQQILTKVYYDRMGHVFDPGYIGMWCDTDFTYQARKDGVTVDGRGLVWDHRHHSVGGCELDEIGRRQEGEESHRVGRELFELKWGKL